MPCYTSNHLAKVNRQIVWKFWTQLGCQKTCNLIPCNMYSNAKPVPILSHLSYITLWICIFERHRLACGNKREYNIEFHFLSSDIRLPSLQIMLCQKVFNNRTITVILTILIYHIVANYVRVLFLSVLALVPNTFHLQTQRKFYARNQFPCFKGDFCSNN